RVGIARPDDRVAETQTRAEVVIPHAVANEQHDFCRTPDRCHAAPRMSVPGGRIRYIRGEDVDDVVADGHLPRDAVIVLFQAWVVRPPPGEPPGVEEGLRGGNPRLPVGLPDLRAVADLAAAYVGLDDVPEHGGRHIRVRAGVGPVGQRTAGLIPPTV